jgi:hypothetical protein
VTPLTPSYAYGVLPCSCLFFMQMPGDWESVICGTVQTQDDDDSQKMVYIKKGKLRNAMSE